MSAGARSAKSQPPALRGGRRRAPWEMPWKASGAAPCCLLALRATGAAMGKPETGKIPERKKKTRAAVAPPRARVGCLTSQRGCDGSSSSSGPSFSFRRFPMAQPSPVRSSMPWRGGRERAVHSKKRTRYWTGGCFGESFSIFAAALRRDRCLAFPAGLRAAVVQCGCLAAFFFFRTCAHLCARAAPANLRAVPRWYDFHSACAVRAPPPPHYTYASALLPIS